MNTQQTPAMTAAQMETLQRIARKTLGIETLATRNNDSLDFHDLAVWSIESALQAAFAAGAQSK